MKHHVLVYTSHNASLFFVDLNVLLMVVCYTLPCCCDIYTIRPCESCYLIVLIVGSDVLCGLYSPPRCLSLI